MYVRIAERLGQVPMRHGSFAGTLGDSPLPPIIQSFVDRVKGSPQDYEALLLISAFHEAPHSSDHLSWLHGNMPATYSIEEIRATIERVVQELLDVHTRRMGKDKRYSELVNKEKQLIQVVSGAFTKRIKELETKPIGWLENPLIGALLADNDRALTEVGHHFVLYTLPLEIAERVLNSRVPETHYARLGKVLLLIAEQRQKGNAAFKQRVEQERKKQRK